jgi:hypothetical protein
MPNEEKKLDKELYRYAREQYRAWNLAEQRDRYLTAHERTPEKNWQYYQSCWAFALKLSPKASEWQEKQDVADWERYYERLRRFEEWRIEHGKTT